MAKSARRMPPVGGTTGVQRLDLQTFARRLHDRRTELGLSQSDVARAIWGEYVKENGGTAARNRDRISQYEMGKSFPDAHNLKRLADVLEVSVEHLAPDLLAATIDREQPSVQMTAVHGHADKVHLVVNILVPMTVAASVINLLSAYVDGPK